MENIDDQQVDLQKTTSGNMDVVARKAKKLDILEVLFDIAGAIIEQIIDAVT